MSIEDIGNSIIELDNLFIKNNLTHQEKISVLDAMKTKLNMDLTIDHIVICKDCRDKLRMALK